LLCEDFSKFVVVDACRRAVESLEEAKCLLGWTSLRLLRLDISLSTRPVDGKGLEEAGALKAATHVLENGGEARHVEVGLLSVGNVFASSVSWTYG
jgi:hypothetical protein